MRSKIESFKETRLWQIIDRFNLVYLAIPFLMWLIKAELYTIASNLNIKTYTFNFGIDDKIPFIKYFFIFYFLYYFLPPIGLWLLSFYDKKRYWHLALAFGICVIICFIFFCCYNVVMIRQPGYPNDIGFKDIRDISTFFDYCINWIYNRDPLAKNCFPSLHALAGALLVLTALYNPKGKNLPIWLSCILFISGLGCAASTFFIKQHYFIDAIVGFFMLFVVYGVVILINYLITRKRNIE